MTIGISRFLDGSLFSSKSYRPAADGEKTDKNMSGWYFRLAIKTFEMYLTRLLRILFSGDAAAEFLNKAGFFYGFFKTDSR